MRILAATVDAGGNTPPTVAILSELARRGHEVLVLGHATQHAALAAAGPHPQAWSSARAWSPQSDDPGLRTMLSWLSLASDPGYGRDLAAAVTSRPADVVLVDCMIPGALRAARATGARVAVLAHAYSGYWRTQWSRRSPMGWWLRATGAHPGRRRARPDLLVVTTLPELDVLTEGGRGLLNARTVQTGPILDAAVELSGPATDDRPLLVSLSTISYPGQRACLQRILDAFDGLPVRAVATVGTSLEARLRPPPNVTVQAFAPHREVMPGVRAVVGHGGHGTTMLALAHGLPVLMFPMSGHADQPLVAASVTAAGAGLTLPREAGVAEIRSGILRLINDAGLRRRAAALGARVRGAGGAAAAAAALESLVR